MNDEIELPEPEWHPWLRHHQRLTIALTLVHVGASVLHKALLTQGMHNINPTDTISIAFGVGFQAFSGCCLWILTGKIRSAQHRGTRLFLASLMGVYPCMVLMMPFNIVASITLFIKEMQTYRPHASEKPQRP